MNPEPPREKPRRWKKGQGTYAKLRKTLWSPFEPDGTVDMARLEREGFTRVGAIVDEGKKFDITSWMDEQAEKVLSPGPIVFDENGDGVTS